MSEPASAEDPLAQLDAYDFELPEQCIAQSPTERREEARMLVVDRASGKIVEAGAEHRVRDLPRWLQPGDLLVLNTTRVLSARLRGHKRSGGMAEALLLGPVSSKEGSTHPGVDAYRALLKCTGRVRVGLELRFGVDETLEAKVAALHDRGEVTLVFAAGRDPYAHGTAPLPPYIRRESASEDANEIDLARYQTVFARTPGAIAAPTAGLHLTHALLEALRAKGVEIAEVVLHVGAGTFRPLDAAALETGRLHRETFELSEQTAEAIARARARGGRVVAVGTTTTRVLESQADPDGSVRAGNGETDLFMRPGGAPFRVVDALLTNFHLPRSSLLLLVAAFVGREPLLAAYHQAIEAGFRFYSYGDAMLIAPVSEEALHG